MIEPESTKEMNDRQKAFCEEYVIDFNGRKSAIRAGYEESCAAQTASELLTYPKVQEYLTYLKSLRSERVNIRQDDVVYEIAKLAFSDLRKAFDDNNNLLSVKDWPDDIAVCISSIKVTEEKKNRADTDDESVTWVKEIKLWDKSKNLELLCRHLGLFNDKLNIGGQKENPLIVQEAPKLTKEEWLKAHGIG